MLQTRREGTHVYELHQTVGSGCPAGIMCMQWCVFLLGKLRYGVVVSQGDTALNSRDRQAGWVPKRIEWIAVFWRKQ